MLNLENIKTTQADFLKLIEIIPDAIVIVDNEGKIRYINSQTTNTFGYNPHELIGQTVEILLPHRFKSKHIDHRTNYSKHPARRPMGSGIDLYGRKKDGTEFSADITISPIETENGMLVISVIRDISERKAQEEAAKRRAKQLEDLVSTMTHDLKTPLIAAETSYKHLQEGYFDKLTENQKQIITLLTQSNAHTLRLVNNLLSVFKYESQSYKLLLERIEVSKLLDRAHDKVKPFLKDKEINLKVTKTNFQFICDPFEIERVIVNLLTNAIKYTQNNETIELQAVKDEDGNVIISVQDNGIGISAEDLPNLFERFWQSTRSNSSSNSTGLGLYLSRQIVEAHGGKIWAESTRGKGATISFKIPAIT
ncbi:MAG: PAS domain-containing sensor histidine kinase [Candidatus Melainabacteria bacterium]|nr:PAS domain-containing sensor histidine kinase [Candidatus Melainabacteria bacterium]